MALSLSGDALARHQEAADLNLYHALARHLKNSVDDLDFSNLAPVTSDGEH